MAANAAGRKAGLGHLVVGTGTEYAESFVGRTLEFRKQASSGARNALDRALDSGVRVNKFQHASKAPINWLKEPVLDALDDDNVTLAAALLGVWAEMEPELRDVVTEHLRRNGGAVDSAAQGDMPWLASDLDANVELIVKQVDGLNERDAALMICFVSGKGVYADGPVQEITSPLLLEYLEELEGMDPNAPDWQDIPHFVDAVVELDVARVRRAADTAIAGVTALVEKALGDLRGGTGLPRPGLPGLGLGRGGRAQGLADCRGSPDRG